MSLSILRQLFQAAEAFRARDFSSESTSCAPQTVEVPLMVPAPYELPQPPSILENLLEKGAPPALAEKVSQRYASSSRELWVASQNILLEARKKLEAVPRHSSLVPLSNLLENLTATHTDSYLKALRRLEDAALNLVERVKEQFPCKKHDFNYDYIPCLEAFFEHNSRPTKADQDVMAKKSRMTRRQIQVWFQNHRRRAKKPLRTMQPDDRAEDVDLSDMERKLGGVYVVPPQFRQEAEYDDFFGSSDDQDEEDYDDDEDAFSTPEPDGPLDLMRPLGRPQSLPKFAELCNSQKRLTFPPPKWRRKASSSPPSLPSVTPDELARHLGRLNVRDSVTSAEGRFMIPTATLLPCSPLPAFLPSFPQYCIPPCVSPIQDAFGSTSFQHKRPRKVATLPCRFPSWSPTAASRRRTPISRTPSLESCNSSRRSSLGPQTPEGAVFELPVLEDEGGAPPTKKRRCT